MAELRCRVTTSEALTDWQPTGYLVAQWTGFTDIRTFQPDGKTFCHIITTAINLFCYISDVSSRAPLRLLPDHFSATTQSPFIP